jgi:hypothetical protein
MVHQKINQSVKKKNVVPFSFPGNVLSLTPNYNNRAMQSKIINFL